MWRDRSVGSPVGAESLLDRARRRSARVDPRRAAPISRATTARVVAHPSVSSRTGGGRAPRRSPRPSPRPPPARDMSATTSLLDRPWPTPDELADARASALELAREAGVTGVAASDVVVTLAPYRVCTLGAHVDHQGGRVLGMALNCGITLAFVPVPDSARLPASTVLLRSDAFAGEVRFDLLDDDESMPPPSSSAADAPGGWGAYPRGAAAVLRAALRPNPLAAGSSASSARRPPEPRPVRRLVLRRALRGVRSRRPSPSPPPPTKTRRTRSRASATTRSGERSASPAPWRPSASASSAASSTKPPRSSPGAAP